MSINTDHLNQARELAIQSESKSSLDKFNQQLMRDNAALIQNAESLRAELAAEREKVEALVTGVNMKNIQLATLTLDNQRLREALEHALKARITLCRNSDADDEDGDPLKWDSYCKKYHKALSTPTDTAALDAYVAEKVEQLSLDLKRAIDQRRDWEMGYSAKSEELAIVRGLLKDASKYTRHPDYDWDSYFCAQVDAAIAAQEPNK